MTAATIWILYLNASVPCALAAAQVSAQPQDAKNASVLTEETRELNAEHEAWRRSQEEYLTFRENGGGSELEEQEFAVYVAELQYRVLVRCEVVDEMGGDVSQYIPISEPPPQVEAAKSAEEEAFAAEGDAKPSGSRAQDSGAQLSGISPVPLSMPIRMPLPERKKTQAEKVADLDKQIEGVGKELDESVARSKERAEGRPAGQESSGGWNGGEAGGTQAGGGSRPAQAGGAAAGATGQPHVAGSPPQVFELGGGPGVAKENAMKTERGPTADRSDDSVLLRQIWERAQNSEDEFLKAALMKKYNEQKNAQSP